MPLNGSYCKGTYSRQLATTHNALTKDTTRHLLNFLVIQDRFWLGQVRFRSGQLYHTPFSLFCSLLENEKNLFNNYPICIWYNFSFFPQSLLVVLLGVFLQHSIWPLWGSNGWPHRGSTCYCFGSAPGKLGAPPTKTTTTILKVKCYGESSYLNQQNNHQRTDKPAHGLITLFWAIFRILYF